MDEYAFVGGVIEHVNSASQEVIGLHVPRLVSIMCSGDRVFRAMSLDALVLVGKRFPQLVVEGFSGDTGLGSLDIVACSECALAIGRLLKSGDWSIVVPRLVQLAGIERSQMASEQALLEIRKYMGRETFFPLFCKTIPSSWTLWHIFRLDKDLLDLQGLKSLAHIPGHRSTRREIMSAMLSVMDENKSIELQEAALRVCLNHYSSEDCQDLVVGRPEIYKHTINIVEEETKDEEWIMRHSPSLQQLLQSSAVMSAQLSTLKKKKRPSSSYTSPRSPQRQTSAPVVGKRTNLLAALENDSDWAQQQEALVRIDNVTMEILLVVLRLTASLRSSLAKSSLSCLKRLIETSQSTVWKELSSSAIDNMVNSLLKKTIDSSAFLAQEANQALVACISKISPQKLCNSLLMNCHTNTNANIRAVAAEFLHKLVETHPMTTYDSDRVVQCATQKLLRDNTVQARAAAKQICIKLQVSIKQPDQSLFDRIGKKPVSISRKKLASTTTPLPSNHVDADLLTNLRSNQWQIRLETLLSCRLKMAPEYLTLIAAKVEDPNLKVKMLAIQIVSESVTLYEKYVHPDKLATMLIPIASAVTERSCQKASLDCIQKYKHIVAVPMQRHLHLLTPKANILLKNVIKI